MWESIASFLLKFALKEGWLTVQSLLDAAEVEREAVAKDALNKQQAIDDLRGAGNDSTKTVEQNEKDAEDAFNRFDQRMQP